MEESEHDDRVEAMSGPLMWELGKTSSKHSFFSILHEIITAHTLWTKLTTNEKAAYLANCGQGVGATWADTAPEQGMPDEEWKTKNAVKGG